MTELERLEQELAPLADSVRGTLEKIEQEIVEAKAELRGLGAMRTRMQNLLKQLDPNGVPQKKTARKREMSGPKYDEFRDWLVSHTDEINEGTGIWASELERRADFTIWPSQSQISKALGQAHDDGILRIDSLGQGGRKHYKVVA